MNAVDDHLLDWLRTAHAMEEHGETLLSAFIARSVDHPRLQARLQSHLDETRAQAERLRQCIERRGGSVSGLKDFAGKATALVQSLIAMAPQDEMVRTTQAAFAFEQLEIAAYTTLVVAAQMAGDGETARIASEIIDEEQAMADFLIDALPNLTETYLERAAIEAGE